MESLTSRFFYEPAATFEEIGQAIGASPTRTWFIYRNALAKIRKNNTKTALREWKETIELRRRLMEGETL